MKKTDKIFVNFFPDIKCEQDIIKKAKKGFSKRLMEGIKIFLKKMKTKTVSMLINKIEIFLKKVKTKSVNVLVNDT